MRNSTLLPTTLIALALSATVGCSVDVSGPARSTQTQSPISRTTTSTSASASASAASSGGSSGPLRITGSYSTQTADCSGRDVVIAGSSNKLVFKGTCGSITLTGGYNTIAVEAVDTLQVLGGGNEAYVKAVGTIQLTGAAYTTVRWVAGAGAGSDPDVSGTGGTNTVEKISEQDYEDKIAS
jgi:hypothetical protein